MMVPIPNIVVLIMVIRFITAVVYAVILYALIKARRSPTSSFRSSFYSIFIMHSVADLSQFVFIELVYRPRMYNYFDLFNKNMISLAQWSLLLLVALRTAVTLGHVVIAFNRFTVFKFVTYHNKMWSDNRVILSGIAVWVVSFLTVLPGWIIFREDIKFYEAADGTLQFSGGRFPVYQIYPTNFLFLLVVILCCYFYGYSIDESRSILVPNRKIEHRLLLNAIVSSLPFLFEFFRVCLMFYGKRTGNRNITQFTTQVWMYAETATFLVQVLVPITINKNFRYLTYNMIRSETSSVRPI